MSESSADPLDVASAYFTAGRWEEAVAAFELAARTVAEMPPAAVRQWGIAASEAGRPLAAYVRLRQYLAGDSDGADADGADRDSVTARVSRARDTLLASAGRFSRVLASAEQRADSEYASERRLARVAARDGDVSLEALRGARIESPVWRRADEIRLAPYLDLIRQLLDAPALVREFPAQAFDPNAPGPRRAAVLRLVIGDEERRGEALRGEPYDRLRQAVDLVLEFARRVPAIADGERKAPPSSPPTTRKKKR